MNDGILEFQTSDTTVVSATFNSVKRLGLAREIRFELEDLPLLYESNRMFGRVVPVGVRTLTTSSQRLMLSFEVWC